MRKNEYEILLNNNFNEERNKIRKRKMKKPNENLFLYTKEEIEKS